MAAPSTDRPVTVTVGAIWRFRVEPPPPRHQRLSVAIIVGSAAVILSRLFIGAVYFTDCPQQPNIPIYLLVLALSHLLMILLMAQPWELPEGLKQCLCCLMFLSLIPCILAGDWLVFSVYQPNYDPAVADGLYCDKTLYTFAFSNVVWETSLVFVYLAKLCKGVLCCVMMSPAPANRDFYQDFYRNM